MSGSSVPLHCSLQGFLLESMDPYRLYNLRRLIRDIFSRTLTRISMYVTRPRRYSRDRPHMLPPPHRPPHPPLLSLGNYHIRNDRVSGIAQAIWEARIDGFIIMIMTETNITDQEYCLNSMGYNVV